MIENTRRQLAILIGHVEIAWNRYSKVDDWHLPGVLLLVVVGIHAGSSVSVCFSFIMVSLRMPPIGTYLLPQLSLPFSATMGSIASTGGRAATMQQLSTGEAS